MRREKCSQQRKPTIGPHVISKTNYCVLIVAAYIHLCFYLNIQLDHILGGLGWELGRTPLSYALIQYGSQKLAQCLAHNWCSVDTR